VQVRQPNGDQPCVVGLSPTSAIDPDVARSWLGRARAYTPVDDMIDERMRDWLAPDLIDSGATTADCFDRFQFLTGLMYFDEQAQHGSGQWAPIGTFGWRRKYGWAMQEKIRLELERHGDRWPLLEAGLFGSDLARAKAALEGYGRLVQQAMNQRF
jgi:hypothetical protein